MFGHSWICIGMVKGDHIWRSKCLLLCQLILFCKNNREFSRFVMSLIPPSTTLHSIGMITRRRREFGGQRKRLLTIKEKSLLKRFYNLLKFQIILNQIFLLEMEQNYWVLTGGISLIKEIIPFLNPRVWLTEIIQIIGRLRIDLFSNHDFEISHMHLN